MEEFICTWGPLKYCSGYISTVNFPCWSSYIMYISVALDIIFNTENSQPWYIYIYHRRTYQTSLHMVLSIALDPLWCFVCTSVCEVERSTNCKAQNYPIGVSPFQNWGGLLRKHPVSEICIPWSEFVRWVSWRVTTDTKSGHFEKTTRWCCMSASRGSISWYQWGCLDGRFHYVTKTVYRACCSSGTVIQRAVK